MIEEARGPPHGILLAVVVVIVIAGPMMIGDGEAITEAISEMISPVGLLLLPIILLLTIQFLSSIDRSRNGGSILSGVLHAGRGGAEAESIHRVSGSPFGVALVLCLVLCLVYYRISIFGGGDDDDD